METKSCWIHINEAKGATEDRKEHITPTSTRRQQRGEEYKQVKAAGMLGLPFLLFPSEGWTLQESSGTFCSWIISIRVAGGSCVCSRRLWGWGAELASYAAPPVPECCWAESTPPCTFYRMQLQRDREESIIIKWKMSVFDEGRCWLWWRARIDTTAAASSLTTQ